MFVYGRSVGFPHRIMNPCALWARHLAKWDSCRRVGASALLASSGNSGRRYGQETNFEVVHMVLGSWWEIFENGDPGSSQNIDTNLMSMVVWPGKPFWKSACFDLNSKVTMLVFPGTCSKKNPSPPEPSPWSRPRAVRISRIWEKRKNTTSSISRILENMNKHDFQYFQDYRECWRLQLNWFPIFQGY